MATPSSVRSLILIWLLCSAAYAVPGTAPTLSPTSGTHPQGLSTMNPHGGRTITLIKHREIKALPKVSPAHGRLAESEWKPTSVGCKACGCPQLYQEVVGHAGLSRAGWMGLGHARGRGESRMSRANALLPTPKQTTTQSPLEFGIRFMEKPRHCGLFENLMG